MTVLAKEDGAPLEGIWILIGPEPPETDLEPFVTSPQRSNRWVTDASGRIAASVHAERKVRLMTRSERAPPETLSIEPLAIGETRSVVLRLATRPDLHFVARVVADEDGAPPLNAWASVGTVEELFPSYERFLASIPKSMEEAEEQRKRSLPVDSAGFFELDVLSWQDRAASAGALRHATQLVPITEGHETRDTALEVRLLRSATLDVFVLDAARAPKQDVRVQLVARAHQLLAPSQATRGLSYSMKEVVRESYPGTNVAGYLRIEFLPPRVAFSVRATPKRGPTQIQADELVLEPGETRTLEITIRSGGTLAGWLRKQDGRPVPDAEIWLKARGELRFIAFEPHEGNAVRKARTDAQGRFEFAKVTDGEWIVGTAPVQSRAPSVAEVLVQDGAAERDVLLTAYDELYVRGVVLDPQGRPCQARVVTNFDEQLGPVSAKTDAQGAFALGPLAPGTYELVASAGYKADNLLANSLPLRVTAGDSNVTLTLRSGCSVAGRVVDAAKRSAVQADVTIAQVGGDLALKSTTSKNGKFQFGALEPGVYDLVAMTPGGSCAVHSGLRLDAGRSADSLELAVQPGGRLRVHYDGAAENAKIEIAHDGVRIDWGTLTPGSSRDWLVPVGKNVVLCTESLGARPSASELSVTAGQLAEIRCGAEAPKR